MKVRGIVDDKATDMIDLVWGLGTGGTSLYLLTVAQIRTCFSKCSLPITYFRISWVLIKIEN